MRNHFDEQLELLNSELIEMGALCEKVIALSAAALTGRAASLSSQLTSGRASVPCARATAVSPSTRMIS